MKRDYATKTKLSRIYSSIEKGKTMKFTTSKDTLRFSQYF